MKSIQPNTSNILVNNSNLTIEILSNGGIRRIYKDKIMINLFLGNEMEGGLINIYMRLLNGSVKYKPLIGLGSNSSYLLDNNVYYVKGSFDFINYYLTLNLAEEENYWFWNVEFTNNGPEAILFDLIYCQDIGIADYSAIRQNEYFVSQYIDHQPLNHKDYGYVMASRQNQSYDGKNPGIYIGSFNQSISYATDASQIFGLNYKSDGIIKSIQEGLPGFRLQHEHSMIAIQDKINKLDPKECVKLGFFGSYTDNKEKGSCLADLEFLEKGFLDSNPYKHVTECSEEFAKLKNSYQKSIASYFFSAKKLDGNSITEEELNIVFPNKWRQVERDKEGQLLSFFTNTNTHVVMRKKEELVLRPHGITLQTNQTLYPDESSMASTIWMNGTFHSMVTQGHASLNRLISHSHSYLSLFNSFGLRIFAEINCEWLLLRNPTFFEMELNQGIWFYKLETHTIEVDSSISNIANRFNLSIKVKSGTPIRFLVSFHLGFDSDNGSSISEIKIVNKKNKIFLFADKSSLLAQRYHEQVLAIHLLNAGIWEKFCQDELLFPDGESRKQPYFTGIISSSYQADLDIIGMLVDPNPSTNLFYDKIELPTLFFPSYTIFQNEAQSISEIIPWYLQNALIHFLNPRGLEQFSGGGWGTRDVCQGAVEFLLATKNFNAIRQILLFVFQQQNLDGDWPQWFMLYGKDQFMRPDESHGDIVFWPLIALSEYIKATSDVKFLEEIVTYFDDTEMNQSESIDLHIERAIQLIESRKILNTNLISFGKGDWNDSLQPINEDLRSNLCSSWMVILNYQAYRNLLDIYRISNNIEKQNFYSIKCNAIYKDFQKYLIPKGIVCGLAYFQEGIVKEYFLHPLDSKTNVNASLLPIVYGLINEMFTTEQALEHFSFIDKKLKFLDGVHLFDKPFPYNGGMKKIFERAETASYFGREIGLMYTHAHLRYCETLAYMGKSDDFYHALLLSNPIALQRLVSNVSIRQSNCYYSSSDPFFNDRYDAFENYSKVKDGAIQLEGGWRVYSSGSGISIKIIIQKFLGLKATTKTLILDPVIPKALSGLKVIYNLNGQIIHILYSIKEIGAGVTRLLLNNEELHFIRQNNIYRLGEVQVSLDEIYKLLGSEKDILEIEIS
jgi:cellobiose phosphorylase